MNEMFKDYPDVVSVEQVSDMLRISTSFAYRLLRSGVLPAKKVGSKYIIAKKSVIAFVCAEDKNDRQISG
jgi:excisionase family DNA binding protein